jgi:tight adherence protein B
MSLGLITILTFASVALCVVGVANLVFDLFIRDRSRIEQRMREEFSDLVSERAQSSPLFKDLRNADKDKPLENQSWKMRLQTLIDQAGMTMTAGQLGVITLLLPLLVGSLTAIATWSTLLTGAAVLAAVPIPLATVLLKRRQRLSALCRQLPDAFDVMSRALRAGQTVPSAFQMIASDFPSPIADEFTYCYEQQHLGIAQETALRDMARRTGIMELQIFVVAMIVNSRSGGNLAELLSKLALLLRKRAQLKGRIRALTGEGRMQAVVLSALPLVVFLAMYWLNREYASILLGYPWLIAACCASQVVGALCIHRITQIEY